MKHNTFLDITIVLFLISIIVIIISLLGVIWIDNFPELGYKILATSTVSAMTTFIIIITYKDKKGIY